MCSVYDWDLSTWEQRPHGNNIRSPVCSLQVFVLTTGDWSIYSRFFYILFEFHFHPLKACLCRLQTPHDPHFASFSVSWICLFSLNSGVRLQLRLSSFHGKCPPQISCPNIISKLNNSAQLAEQTHTFMHVNGINELHLTVSVLKPTPSPVTRLHWLTANSRDTKPCSEQTRPADVSPKTAHILQTWTTTPAFPGHQRRRFSQSARGRGEIADHHRDGNPSQIPHDPTNPPISPSSAIMRSSDFVHRHQQVLRCLTLTLQVCFSA